MNRFLLLLAALGLSATAPAQTPRTAVVATYAYAKYDRAAALQPLADRLAAELGQPVTVRLLESPRALAQALREGTVDVAVTNTFVYLAVRAQPRLQAAAVFEVPAATLDAYRGVLLARRDGKAADLAALKRNAGALRYAQVIPGSTSGGLVQDLFLAAQGLDRAGFGSVKYAGTHDAALASLADGSADLAALADAPWQALHKQGGGTDLVALWRSPPIPPGPVVCRDDGQLPCARVAALLQSLEADSAALQGLVKAWSEAAGATRLVPVQAAPYDALTAGFADPAAGRAALEKLL
ncbi:phosphate/phosphite/phosphonate ABC transporter substrate-binding protein [Tahibacter harae]|uniref:PhnD/SsuA/transferrin family substrate-binding protein n=1 Tax=Tahibacter harae TaxID=2963937 RepID=A0ABT1QPI0_9GAMM|nr:PhnD/SsuA/transferrin family substrate-binding protein [Tahibacter harae]MCQ4164193.1 PhnD/SsuA/transferrin family substrate-binding protein [Tahibacter harae]